MLQNRATLDYTPTRCPTEGYGTAEQSSAQRYGRTEFCSMVRQNRVLLNSKAERSSAQRDDRAVCCPTRRQYVFLPERAERSSAQRGGRTESCTTRRLSSAHREGRSSPAQRFSRTACYPTHGRTRVPPIYTAEQEVCPKGHGGTRFGHMTG